MRGHSTVRGLFGGLRGKEEGNVGDIFSAVGSDEEEGAVV